ncbi:EpsG family protein [Flavobacterium sp. 245]|uniref:EpsG family protein n=1 Tax=Flavobacterium sp. 245 TaxID=2512115 RepID=UPI0010622238|nr:EpsG family protein [Flavobacterium sp. 245]TDP00904.1 EpsG-like putative glucosyltransferase [Flavobacterium sp. 245]
MTVYIITFFLFLIFGYLDFCIDLDVKKKNTLYRILFLILVFQVGLRWETGTDWIVYRDNFENTTSIQMVLLGVLDGFEIGYGLFVYFIRNLTDNYVIFLFVHALIYYLLILKSNKQLSPYPIVSLLLLYVTNMGVLGSNRQLLALAICLFSLQYVFINKKALYFFPLVAFASLFHTTAIIFAVYYFLDRDFKKYQIILVLGLSFIIGKTSLPSLLFSGFGSMLGGTAAMKAEIYSNTDKIQDASLSLIGLIRRIMYFVLFLYNYDKLAQKIKSYRLLFNGFAFGLAFYFLFADTLIILVNRGSLYFNIMETFLLTSQLLLFVAKDRGYVLFFISLYSILLFFQSISAYDDLFIPYEGIFINTDLHREMH